MELPDWRTAVGYPQPGKASNARFAWEFLRRNPKYQSAWREYSERLRACAEGEPEVLRLVDALHGSADSEAALWKEFDERGIGRGVAGRLEDLEPWIDLPKGDDAGGHRSVPLGRHLAEPWGLEFIANPARTYSMDRVRFIQSKRSIMPTSYGLRELEKAAGKREGVQVDSYDLGRTRWLILQVDLVLPLEVNEAIVSRAIRAARRLRKEKGWIKPIDSRASSPEKLIEYLRILDARESGATFVEIGAVLHPRQSNESPDYARDKRVKAAFKAAVRLRDEDFRVLPILKDRIRRTVQEK